jgi:two-component system, response regulator YesN
MKVLIVDDEILVRKGISMGVDWKSLGFDEVKEASNGQDAFEYAKKEFPNLVLTDIKMPKMDGIELIEKLKTYCPDTVIIVLSCVDDVEYVRKSMMFGGAVDYILKLSLSTEDLYEIVKKATIHLRTEKSQIGKEFTGSEINQNNLMNEPCYFAISKEVEKLIIKNLEICNLEALKSVIRSIFEEAKRLGVCKENFYVRNDLLAFMNDEIKKQQGDIGQLSINGVHPYKFVEESKNIYELENRVLNVIDEVIPYLNQLRNSNYSLDIDKAVKYILENYKDNITLSDVGALVGLNTAYLSRKFKEETGTNFIDFVNTVRINKAKGYLRESNLQMYEIATAVGFSNDTYFSRMFKAIEGISPKQFQKSLKNR